MTSKADCREVVVTSAPGTEVDREAVVTGTALWVVGSVFDAKNSIAVLLATEIKPLRFAP